MGEKKYTFTYIKKSVEDAVKETPAERKKRMAATDGGRTTMPKTQPSGKSEAKEKDIRNGRKNLANNEID